ncbi:hypothetical protein HHX47_DHR1000789 [Lentinula edodes]|nr:hypothetical protein HHX47_DHR1000789 [Lentinula edodes]
MVQPTTICGQSARVYLEYNHATDIPAREAGWTRFVCLSDTHSATHWDNGGRMPRGDVLLHAGDLSSWGTVQKLKKTVDWLGNLEGYATKMLMAKPRLKQLGLTYLEFEETRIRESGIAKEWRVFGSPASPRHSSGAFQYGTKEARGMSVLTWK